MAWAMVLSLFTLSAITTLLIVLFRKGNSLPELSQDIFDLVPTLGLLLALVFGASSSGWEFASHTLPSILAREPNRLVVWASKLAVLAIVSVVFTIATGVGGILGLVIGSAFETVPTTAGWLGHAALTVLEAFGQASVQTFVAALFGAALAMLLRSTVAAVAVGMGFIFVIDMLIALALDQIRQGLGDYTFGEVVRDFGTKVSTFGMADTTLSYASVTLVLAAWAALFISVGYSALRFRNVA